MVEKHTQTWREIRQENTLYERWGLIYTHKEWARWRLEDAHKMDERGFENYNPTKFLSFILNKDPIAMHYDECIFWSVDKVAVQSSFSIKNA